ncbi:MAG: HNH endonuclease signature motif containing protein [Rhizomicrobium sp.]
MAKPDPTGPSTTAVKRLLLRSGNRCAFPKCSVSLLSGETVIGEICHIAAAKSGGPRYDGEQSATERHSYDNLILLCPLHHKVVDDDVESYSAARLLKMKADHESKAEKISEEEASQGAQLLLSVNQVGGITAHTVNQTFNINTSLSSATPVPTTAPTKAGMLFFRPGEVLANVGFPGEQQYTFEGARAHFLRLFVAGPHSSVTQARLQEIFRGQYPCPMSLNIGHLYSRNEHGAIVFDTVGQVGIGALTQGTTGGELWGLNDRLFVPHQRSAFPGQSNEVVTVLPMVAVEKMYVRALANYIKVAQSQMHMPFPYTVELGGYGLRGCYLGVPGGYNNAGQLAGPILSDAFRRTYTLESDALEVIQHTLKSYFEDFYDLAACSRPDVWTDELVAAHGVAPR